MDYEAINYGIMPNQEVAEKLNALLEQLSKDKEEKTLIFQGGTYFLDAEKCPKELLYVTNTIGDNEWKKSETPHLIEVGLNFKNIENLVVKGNGCMFVMLGAMTNIAMDNCKNITLDNFSIRSENPDAHELEVVKKGLFSMDFKLDKESSYINKQGKFYFVGKDYQVSFYDSVVTAHWIGKINKNNPNRLKRVGHPLCGAFKIVELQKNLFRAYYVMPRKFDLGDSFYLFDVRRKYVGIFANKVENLAINNINQHFNYSLGLVCQDCQNVDMTNCNFAPHKDSSKLIASLADFIQICMCRGNVNITRNNFLGAGDDCINTHGIHFKIDKISQNYLTVKFCHPQSHGFNPLRVGDTIRFVNPQTLEGDKTAKILESQLIDEFSIRLKVDTVKGAIIGDVIENLDACPNLNFSNNSINRIITRGVLVTTSGKVIIKDNLFIDTFMNSILMSDDAKNWYESGNVKDVTISGNTFLDCDGYNVCVKPENGANKNYVHSNITIENNIMSKTHGGVMIKCAKNVKISDNSYLKRIKIINSQVKINEV